MKMAKDILKRMRYANISVPCSSTLAWQAMHTPGHTGDDS